MEIMGILGSCALVQRVSFGTNGGCRHRQAQRIEIARSGRRPCRERALFDNSVTEVGRNLLSARGISAADGR
jgi:hypothetical protein